MNTQKTIEVLDQLVDKLIGSEELPGTLAKTIIGNDGPMKKWSLMNQLAVTLHGYSDARGYRQWQKAGRHVIAGQKAIYILGPMMVAIPVTDDEDRETGEKVQKLVGFKTIPVFGCEQTEGEELAEYKERADLSKSLPRLPLISAAQALGIKVSAEFSSHGEAGYYSPDAKIIGMCSSSQQTFLHELSHAVDHELGSYKEYDSGEIVAELSACFLSHLLGLKANMKYTQNYIRSWSGGQHVALKIIKAIERVKAIYDYLAKDIDQAAA